MDVGREAEVFAVAWKAEIAVEIVGLGIHAQGLEEMQGHGLLGGHW